MRIHARGLSLIELLVAMTIGSLLLVATVYVYSQTRKTHTVTEEIARLQENGRYIFSVLEPDIQLAGYYGFSNYPGDLKYIKGGSTATVVPAADLVPDKDDVLGIASSVSCGKNFMVNVLAAIESSNGKYDLGCAAEATAGGALDGPDTLTIRRSTIPPADGVGKEAANTVQVLVSRLSPSSQFILTDGVLPPEPELKKDLVQVRDLVVRSYYIAKDSTNPTAKGMPALRVKTLVSGPRFVDEEVMRGVEDIQFQFGIDTGSYDGNAAIDPGLDENGDGVPDVTRGIATHYVNPGSIPAGAQVVSVRVWVLLRAEQVDLGYKDVEARSYADRVIPAPNDGYRRVLMSRTIQLRNSRQF